MEKIIGILFLVPSSMLSTISALASQNIGAGKHDRVKKGTRECLAMSVAAALAFSAVFMPNGRFCFSVFTEETKSM